MYVVVDALPPFGPAGPAGAGAGVMGGVMSGHDCLQNPQLP